MPMARLKKKRRAAREAFAALFPRAATRVTCGPYQRERHLNKLALHEMAMKSPVEALEHLQD